MGIKPLFSNQNKWLITAWDLSKHWMLCNQFSLVLPNYNTFLTQLCQGKETFLRFKRYLSAVRKQCVRFSMMLVYASDVIRETPIPSPKCVDLARTTVNTRIAGRCVLVYDVTHWMAEPAECEILLNGSLVHDDVDGHTTGGSIM